jgi:hypothetical protein
MKLEIRSVKSHGDLANERIMLKAISDVNIGAYMISDTTYQSDHAISNKLRHIFWIPDKDVEEDDLIVIYTKSGTDKRVRNSNSGKSTHFFYWGLEGPIWNKGGDTAVLFFLNDWSFKRT